MRKLANIVPHSENDSRNGGLSTRKTLSFRAERGISLGLKPRIKRDSSLRSEWHSPTFLASGKCGLPDHEAVESRTTSTERKSVEEALSCDEWVEQVF